MKNDRMKRKKFRIRKKISGTDQKPRLTLYKSCKSLHAQMIDDVCGKTLIGVMSKGKKNSVAAKDFGKLIAEKAKEKNISTCVFDRNGYQYHGIVKDFADSVRENGITI
jgi:large subunit ribosomal protein L18